MIFREALMKKNDIDYLCYFLEKAFRTIANSYYGDFSIEDVYHAAIQGMMQNLDQYSIYEIPKSTSLSDSIKNGSIEISTLNLSACDKSQVIFLIKILRIDKETCRELKTLISSLDSNEHFAIIDLQNNPGGYSEYIIEICKMLVTEGIMFSRCNCAGKSTDYFSTLKQKPFKKIVALVSPNTMSAAEVIAGALQDNGNVVIGHTTFGKGVGQLKVDLYDGGVISITTQEYFRTNKDKINGLGITPDIETTEAQALTTALVHLGFHG